MALFGKKKKTLRQDQDKEVRGKKSKAAVPAEVSVVKKPSSVKVTNNKEKKEARSVVTATGLAREVIRIQQPIVSEKTMRLSADQNQYAFVVDRDATKPEIKKQIKQRYNVEVVRVRTIRLQGKATLFRGKRSNPTPVKKAIITVQKGQKIDIAGNV
jgi:large subunit ribosomal protein L23